MQEQSYWTKWQQRRVSRRRALGAIAAGGAGLAALGIAGCGTKQPSGGAPAPSAAQGAQGTPQRGGTLNVYFRQNMPLDPQKVSATPQRAVSGVYSRLFKFKTGLDPHVIENHDTENDLGTSLESPDAITWTVKLRPDAKFQNISPVNGHPVEAEDVKATFTRAIDPATASPNRGSLGMMDAGQIETPDKHTVVFKLTYPYSPFPKILASAVFSWILPREVLSPGYDPAVTVIGSGPFSLERAEPDVAYTYKRNPGWFEKGQPYIDGYKMAVITDANTQIAQFAGGNLDELVIGDPYSLSTVKQQNPKATIEKEDYSSANPLYFQLGDPTSLFLDERVRHAFSMAINRDAINKSIYDGQGEDLVYVPAYMGKWAMKVKDLPADVQQWYKYDPAEAKKLLSAAGFGDTPIKLADFSTQPAAVKQLEAINSMLKAAGVNTAIVQGDYNKDFVDGGHGWRQGYFDKNFVGAFHQAPYEDADYWLFVYFDSRSTENQEHLKDPDYDAMIDHERTLLDQSQRLAAVRKIQEYLANKMYAPNTPGGAQWTAISPRVRNYQFTSTLGIGTETYAKLWLQR